MAKVESIDVLDAEETYDIGVEQYHNFITNGFVVHNCMQVSKVLSGFTGPIESSYKDFDPQDLHVVSTLVDAAILVGREYLYQIGRTPAGGISPETFTQNYHYYIRGGKYTGICLRDRATELEYLRWVAKNIDLGSPHSTIWNSLNQEFMDLTDKNLVGINVRLMVKLAWI